MSSHFSFAFPCGSLSKRLITTITVSSDIFGIPKTISAKALWDTGATISAITPHIAKVLGVPVVARIPVAGVHNASIVDVVTVSILLPNQTNIPDTRVAVCALNPSINAIIGMDIILRGDFAISNGKNETLFSFAMPPFDKKIDLTRWSD
jgi:hypothetical protein